MNQKNKLHGVVVPMVTPVTDAGDLDEPAVDRLVDFLLAGGVEGIFVVGTTGEGGSVPPPLRRRLVERVVQRVRGRARVYAGAGDTHPRAVAAGNDYLRCGADVVVCRPPFSLPADELENLYRKLLDGLDGPLVIYNIPMTTKVSIPLEVIGKFVGHPKLVGLKDSENNPQRLEETMRRFGGRADFSIFVGVGALMASGLKLGADGIVPSVGNLIPDVCHQLCAAARSGDWAAAGLHSARMNEVAALYQKGRTLDESLAVLKAAMSCRGICGPAVLPPLRPLSADKIKNVRDEMLRLHLLNGK